MYRDGLRVTVVSELLRGELPSDGGREELHQRITATTEGPATRSSSAPLVGTVHGEAVAGERLNNAVPTAAAMAPGVVSGGWLLSERQVTGMTRRWIGVVVLFGIIFAYCVIGSLMFTAIEGPLDSENMGKATTLRQIFVNDVVRQVLANSSCAEGSDGQTLIGYDVGRGASLSDECRMFLSQVQSLVQGRVQSTAEQFERDLVDMVKSGRYRKNPQWDFWSGWFYSGTIITTIGYGHIVPATNLGRAMTMVYALIGTPLFLVLLSDSGKLLTWSLKLVWAVIRRLGDTLCSSDRSVQALSAACKVRANSPSYVVDEKFDLPLLVALFLGLCYLMIGAAIFQRVEEDWTFFETLYFVVISMFTIGFGDYVITDSVTMAASMVYFVFGLSLTSMCINIVKQRFSALFSTVGTKISDKIRSKRRRGSPRQVEVAPVHGGDRAEGKAAAWLPKSKEVLIAAA